jgi:FO synthase
MNESISRAASAAHDQELTVADRQQRAATSAGHTPEQRTTLYGQPAKAASAPLELG